MSYREYKSSNRISVTNTNKDSGMIVSSPDKTLFTIVMFLVFIGFLAIFSATAPKCQRDGIFLFSFLIKQVIFTFAGFISMLFFIRFDYKKLEKFNKPFLYIVIALLLILQFTPLGVTINGAKRWINLGFMQLQPSELAKPLFCMLLATMFKDKINLNTLLKNLSNTIVPMLIILGLIYKQPNLSMTIILAMTVFVAYVVARGPLLPIFVGSGVMGVGVLSMLPKLLQGYQMDRIAVWHHPELDAQGKGYNIIQSLIAFASGGFSGVGYGASIQKLAYLPECHTDFIFAIIAEEFGFIGCLFVLGLFVVLVHRGFWIANRCPDMYGKILALSITFIFGFQSLLNMSVASSFSPVTGVTLPFISYGGTSIIVSLTMVGILLNISKQRIRKLGTRIYE